MNSIDTNTDLHLNPNTNLLEQAEFNYILQDVDTPNLYRQNFKYNEIPNLSRGAQGTKLIKLVNNLVIGISAL